MKLNNQATEPKDSVTNPSPADNSIKVVDSSTKRKYFAIGIGLTAIVGGVGWLLAFLPGMAVLGSLTIALLLGIGWRTIAGLNRNYSVGVRFSAQKLLRLGIILTGVRLNFGLIASSGLQVLLLDLFMIIFGIIFINWFGRLLGLKKGLALLLAVGQSICGAAAVGAAAALAPDVDQDDTSLGVAIQGIVGTIGVLFFILCAQLFGVQDRFYGLWSGSTLNEIAQVVAAGPVGGSGAADLSMVVKLTRVVFLAPVILSLAFLYARIERQKGGERKAFDWRKLPIPWFVLGFLVVGAINSLGWFSKDVANVVLQFSILFMVMAMAAMGLLVDLAAVRRNGLRALSVAIACFAVFTLVSFTLIKVFAI